MNWHVKEQVSAVSRWLSGSSAGRPKHIRSAVLPIDEPIVEPELLPLQAPAPNRLILGRVFDSAHPVRNRDELLGRRRELDDLLAATMDFGQHAIVHGARGSGKTSLVRIFGDHADQGGAVVIYMACEPGASFSDLILPYLRALPPTALRPGAREAFARDLAALPPSFGPRAVVELVAERISLPVIFIFDEFDRITDPVVKADIAAAMKLLSDALATVLFILVGIARDVSDVVEAHPSLRRHLRVVALGRIEATSVDALIANGAAAAGIAFDDKARAIVARASCGSPYHVRIFAHHSALAAVRHGATIVSEADARAGLKTALEHWAAMNVADVTTFVKLVESGERLGVIERAARRAAVNDRLEQDGSPEVASTGLLAEAVAPEAGSETAFVFRDSVAPQFLIALIMLAEVSAIDTTHAVRQELSNAVDH